MKQRVLLVIALLIVIFAVIVVPRFSNRSLRPESLATLIDRADRLVVHHEPWEASEILFESSERHDLDALKASLQVEMPEQHLHCMCNGTPGIFLYANGQQIGEITNHHAKLIRCSLWKSDARLVNTEEFLKWFDDRKIPGPRKEYEESQQQDKEWSMNQRKWIEAIPPCLKPYQSSMQSFDPDLAPLRKALAEKGGEKNDRILALFFWYGSGAGPWSGCPAYEITAEKLLLDYSTAELLAAIEGKELTVPRLEGVARFFGGWGLSRRPDDQRLLPDELKARLLKHSLESKDEDKRGRARNAFGGREPKE